MHTQTYWIATLPNKLGLIHFSLRTNPKIMVDEFPVLFNDTMVHIRNIKITLCTENSMTQEAQNYLCIFIHISKNEEKKPKRLEKLDVIEKNGSFNTMFEFNCDSLKESGVPVCITWFFLTNFYQEKENPLPTLDDLITDLNDSTVFS